MRTDGLAFGSSIGRIIYKSILFFFSSPASSMKRAIVVYYLPKEADAAHLALLFLPLGP